MMVHVSMLLERCMRQDGAFFVFSVLISGGYSAESQWFLSLAEPRGSAR
jgi:hypothetical protein